MGAYILFRSSVKNVNLFWFYCIQSVFVIIVFIVVLSILDQESDWGQQSMENLPTYTANSQNTQRSNMYTAKSLDSLAVLGSQSTVNTNLPTQPDPFDTSRFWPIESQTARRNYDKNIGETSTSRTDESQIHSSTNYSASTSADPAIVYNNVTLTKGNNNYGIPTKSTVETNLPNISTGLAEMSLDDKISESLNLRSNESVYSNNVYNNVPSTSSAVPTNVTSQYNDIPIYNNFDINPAQQQFILETKDYYTKLSTPSKVNSSNYEKNIYIPKCEEEGEKLKNFSDCLENSKNYSAFKYQNFDYGGSSTFSDYSTYSGSASRVAYDEVNDTGVNIYSEIAEPGARNMYSNTQGSYANAGLYDEVYEEAVPRPHRPAPPCPSRPK